MQRTSAKFFENHVCTLARRDWNCIHLLPKSNVNTCDTLTREYQCNEQADMEYELVRYIAERSSEPWHGVTRSLGVEEIEELRKLHAIY